MDDNATATPDVWGINETELLDSDVLNILSGWDTELEEAGKLDSAAA